MSGSSLGARLEAVGFDLAAAFARSLPEPMARDFGRGLGRFAYALGIRRRVSEDNVERALAAELDAAARRRVVRHTYEHVGGCFIDFLRLPRRSPAWFERRIAFAGREHLDAALARGRGVVVASGHLGNWESASAGLARHGVPVTFVVQKLNNPRVDATVNRIRAGAGIEVIERGMALRAVHAALAANRVVFMMCDQDARRRGVFVPFFGRLASTPKGAAQLAFRRGAAFLPAFCAVRADGRFECRFTPIVEVEPGDEGIAVGALLATFNQRLEDAVRAHPDQYWWMHRRWKTAPPVTPATAPAAGPGRAFGSAG